MSVLAMALNHFWGGFGGLITFTFGFFQGFFIYLNRYVNQIFHTFTKHNPLHIYNTV